MGYPKMFVVEQALPSRRLADVARATVLELRRVKLKEMVRPGREIAIAASARGIRDQAVIIKSLVEELKAGGTKPFIIPAMGSHGGSTPEGQAALLKGYNITEESVGAPIRSSIDADLIGTTERGAPVHADRYACGADGIVLVNRIKAHIDFEATHESGLYKMMVAGLGKPMGAKYFHLYASKYGYHSVMTEMAGLALERLPVILGIGIVENAYGETEKVRALNSDEMREGAVEADLLKSAKKNMGKIPLDEVDLLIVDEIGKDIAGSGLDTNVIGRKGETETWHAQKPRIKRIIVRGLTEKTQGNALGIGYADFTTNRVVEKIDNHQTYVNAITAHAPHEAKIPMIMENERSAVDAALSTIDLLKVEEARVVRIKNTLELAQFEVSEACLPELKGKGQIQIAQELGEMAFDREGNLPPIFRGKTR